MSIKSLFLFAATAAVFAVSSVHADEYDHMNGAPQGLIVRTDASGQSVEVYKDSKVSDIKNDTDAKNAFDSKAVAINKANSGVLKDEYDKPSMTQESWFYYWGWGYNWYYPYSYSYWYYPYYNNYYYPYYSYYSYPYYYSYYRCW